jgi:WD40 repeat protein
VESLQIGDSIASLAVAPESQSLLIGDEHGSMYAVQYANTDTNSGTSSSGGTRASSRKHIRKLDTAVADAGEKPAEGADNGGTPSANAVEGHYGMVTAVSAKTLKRGMTAGSSATAGIAKGFLRGSGGLVLTTGVDWTVKLWAPAYRDTPLLSWLSNSYDYMCDVQWCPTHPAVFATASSNGTVGLWNLATSMDDPLTGSEGIVVEANAASGQGLNKLRWSPDGRRLAVSSSDRVHMVNLNEEMLRPKGDEDTKIMSQLMTRDLVSRQ